ncbi:MAG: hypothetical protein CMF51_02835 [Legionellales bacterium]|nr:hypothetical protein [Legionellales bacterium]|tara:strand:- start:913 stop:2499 length:1587 start_codon:yes stop_codon:yes gene_type:complete
MQEALAAHQTTQETTVSWFSFFLYGISLAASLFIGFDCFFISYHYVYNSPFMSLAIFTGIAGLLLNVILYTADAFESFDAFCIGLKYTFLVRQRLFSWKRFFCACLYSLMPIFAASGMALYTYHAYIAADAIIQVPFWMAVLFSASYFIGTLTLMRKAAFQFLLDWNESDLKAAILSKTDHSVLSLHELCNDADIKKAYYGGDNPGDIEDLEELKSLIKVILTNNKNQSVPNHENNLSTYCKDFFQLLIAVIFISANVGVAFSQYADILSVFNHIPALPHPEIFSCVLTGTLLVSEILFCLEIARWLIAFIRQCCTTIKESFKIPRIEHLIVCMAYMVVATLIGFNALGNGVITHATFNHEITATFMLIAGSMLSITIMMKECQSLQKSGLSALCPKQFRGNDISEHHRHWFEMVFRFVPICTLILIIDVLYYSSITDLIKECFHALSFTDYSPYLIPLSIVALSLMGIAVVTYGLSGLFEPLNTQDAEEQGSARSSQEGFSSSPVQFDETNAHAPLRSSNQHLGLLS